MYTISSIDDETRLEVEKDVIDYNEKEFDPHLMILLERIKKESNK